MDRRVFLSYRRINAKIVDAFQRELRNWSIDTWRDTSLTHGEQLRQRLSAAIDQSDFLLLFLCPFAIQGIRSGKTGLSEELDIWALRRSLGTSIPSQKLVIVDLVGLTDKGIGLIPGLDGHTGALRLTTGAGLRKAALECKAPPVREVRAAVEEFVRQSIQALEVFSRANALIGDSYESSWLGAGDGDEVIVGTGRSTWEGRERPMIPLERSGDQPALRIAFSHRRSGWWMAIIGFGVIRDGGWATLSATRYSVLRIELRSASSDNAYSVRVRLEDSTQTGTGGSRHNSTSWSSPPTLATDYYQRYDVDLKQGFDWGSESYLFNSAAVVRGSLLQIAIGQEPDEMDQSGVLLVRRVQLLP